MAEIPPAYVEKILEQMGLGEKPDPDLAGLGELYSAWCHHIPFDNCRKLIACRNRTPGPLPGDDSLDFFEMWLKHGVGGTCWASHGAWSDLLTALGFDAHRAVATMMVVPNLPPNHGTVIVNIGSSVYCVDVGIKFVEPLAIIPGRDVTIEHPAWGVRGHWVDDKYAIRWRALHLADPFDCHIDEWPVDAPRFAKQHEATREWSPFNYQLNFNLVKNGGRIGVGMGDAVQIAPDGAITRTPLEDRKGYLIDQLGVSEELARQIPPDVPTPPPPGSSAARMNPERTPTS